MRYDKECSVGEGEWPAGAVPGVRRIPRERERKPPRGDATRRQKHRRITGGLQQDIPSFAPEWHRRGTFRRHLRLRGAGRTAVATRTKMNRQVEPTGGGHATFNPMRRLARWRTHDVTRRVYPCAECRSCTWKCGTCCHLRAPSSCCGWTFLRSRNRRLAMMC